MMGAPERIALIQEGLAALDVSSLDAANVKLQQTQGSVPAVDLDSEQVHTLCRGLHPVSHPPQTSKMMSHFRAARWCVHWAEPQAANQQLVII